MDFGFIYPESTTKLKVCKVYKVESNLHFVETRHTLSSLLKAAKKNRKLSKKVHSYYSNKNYKRNDYYHGNIS